MSDNVAEGRAEHQILGESDWEDDDLLSIAEASERLEAEIVVLRGRLAQEPDGPALTTMAERLTALERVLESINRGPTPLAAMPPADA